MITQNTIQVIDTAKVQVLTLGILQTVKNQMGEKQGSVEYDKHPIFAWCFISISVARLEIRRSDSKTEGSIFNIISRESPKDCLQNRLTLFFHLYRINLNNFKQSCLHARA